MRSANSTTVQRYRSSPFIEHLHRNHNAGTRFANLRTEVESSATHQITALRNYFHGSAISSRIPSKSLSISATSRSWFAVSQARTNARSRSVAVQPRRRLQIAIGRATQTLKELRRQGFRKTERHFPYGHNSIPPEVQSRRTRPKITCLSVGSGETGRYRSAGLSPPASQCRQRRNRQAFLFIRIVDELALVVEDHRRALVRSKRGQCGSPFTFGFPVRANAAHAALILSDSA